MGILPGFGSAIGYIVGSFFCGITGSWVASFLMGNFSEILYGDETELHIDTVLAALRAMDLEVKDPYSVQLAVVEKRWRMLARDVHPDRCRPQKNESREEHLKRLAECTEAMQRLSHHYRVLAAFINNRDKGNWQKIRDRLLEKWISWRGSPASGSNSLAICA